MSVPANSADLPMSEPGKRPTGGDVGGVAATSQAGVADWAERSSERAEPPVSTDRTAQPPGARRESGSDATGAGAKGGEEDDEEWRHEPVAPVDEPNPLRSLGKAIGDTLTGSDADLPASRKR